MRRAHDGLPGAHQGGGRERELALPAAAKQSRGSRGSRHPATLLLKVVDAHRLGAGGYRAGEQRDPRPQEQDGPKHQQESHGRQLQSDHGIRCHANLMGVV
jgi:hypothetical protein